MLKITMDRSTGLPERAYVSEPVARVKQGERFVIESNTCCQPVVRTQEDVLASSYLERKETGPVYIEGIEKGDMMRVELECIRPIGHASGGRHDGVIDFLPIESGRVYCPGGLWAPVKMMIGVIYAVPEEEDGVSYRNYIKYDIGDNGGNLDYRDICAGHSVCLRARREGGLLGLGDMHALQGFGEWLGVGAECAGEVTLRVYKEERFCSDRPVVIKPGSFTAIASRWPFADALTLAISDAADIMAALSGASRAEAESFCRLAGSAMHGQNAHLQNRALIRFEGDVMPATVGFEVPTDCLEGKL